jgi:hypothetical protein
LVCRSGNHTWYKTSSFLLVLGFPADIYRGYGFQVAKFRVSLPFGTLGSARNSLKKKVGAAVGLHLGTNSFFSYPNFNFAC